MKSVGNLSSLIIPSALALVMGVIGSTAYSYLMNENSKTHYAVIDIEDAISKTTIAELQVAKNNDEVKVIVSKGREQVENWLATRLEDYCSAPCVVFNKADVVFGDVVNLNKQYELERLNGKQ